MSETEGKGDEQAPDESADEAKHTPPASLDLTPGPSSSSQEASTSDHPSTRVTPLRRPSRLTLDPNYRRYPVSPEQVRREAAPIFMHFVSQRLLVDQVRDTISANLSPMEEPSLPLLTSPQSTPPLVDIPSPDGLTDEERRVAHRLVELGDILDEEHGSDFSVVLRYLNANGSNVAQHFHRIADILFQKETEPNWSLVVVLFYFGYRLGIECLRHGMKDFLKGLAHAFVNILSRLNLSTWIADEGGWRTILYLAREYIATLPAMFTGLLSIATILALTWSLSRSLR